MKDIKCDIFFPVFQKKNSKRFGTLNKIVKKNIERKPILICIHAKSSNTNSLI